MFVYILGALLLFVSVIMILLILIQRGRGGGLAGAFGGMGGQSALGVRAGDVFTKITVVMAISWVLLAGVLGISMRGAARAELTGDNIKGADAFAAEEDPAAGDEAGEGTTGDEVPETKKAEESAETEGSTDVTDEAATSATDNPAEETSPEAAAEAKPEAETAAPAKPDETSATEDPPADDSK